MMTAVWTQAQRVVLREAACFERRRRAFELTGAQPECSNAPAPYHVREGRDTPYQILRADDVDEPCSDHVVVMLDALPPSDRELYSHEHNIIEWQGKSKQLFKELESHYGFVGGSFYEYSKYFNRDLPKTLWHFAPLEEARAIAGFSVVGKKEMAKAAKVAYAGG